jgi:hypothetical protein
MSALSASDRALLVGILLDGVEAVLRAGEGTQAARRGRDAETWMAADDPDWPFSFVSVCRMLDVDGTALRAALSSARAAGTLRRPRTRPQLPIR